MLGVCECVDVCLPQATWDNKVRQGCVLINQRLVSPHHQPSYSYSWELLHTGREIILYWFTSLFLYLFLSRWYFLLLPHIYSHQCLTPSCRCSFVLSFSSCHISFTPLLPLCLSLCDVCSVALSCFQYLPVICMRGITEAVKAFHHSGRWEDGPHSPHHVLEVFH